MPALSTGSGSDTGLYELLAALPAQLQPHVDSQEDLTFLWDMFGEKSLHSLVKIHEKLHYYEKQNPVPVLHGAAALADDLAEELQSKPLSSEIRELLKLLSKPNLKENVLWLKLPGEQLCQALLSVHDTVAQKNYDPVLPPMPDDIDEEEDSVKIIRLVKNREPLGATIKRDEHTGAIVVARIMRGGAADRSGLIHVGDELREVNGIPVDGKKPEEIIQILAQSQGAITFKIIPSVKEEMPVKEGKMFIRALFDYDPNEDKAIPCKEAGLAFRRGDILQIMSQDDATWWQAKHEGDANPRAGLIPSKHFQERRFALRRPEVQIQPLKISNRKSYAESAGHNSGSYLAGFRRSFRLSRKDKKTNKSMYECKKSDQYDTADIPTYEEVAKYRRQPNDKYRLVVLVGPVGVGLNELKRKLLISDTQHYGVTVPHTTRPRRSQESDGVEYIFISKHLFETDVQNNKFIEYGEYKNNYYGTSLDSVRSVLAKNKVCLLDVQPHTVKHLRTYEFKPFVIFIKPPSLERLRETRKNAKIISSKDDKGTAKPFTEEDFQEMIKSAHLMESQYGHLFDKVIVNDDLTTAYTELKTTFDRLETETFWVPISWLHS
ncbi:MAGUK p55 subfamily member 7 isoform X1 [Cuculus canorus]|uniref:MAGUK p55 subfamily member 7 isoform X1 n=1 Tax=Cuculus canorus TaxID=55661 RepID=UPI0023AAF2C6|nr:MAGUK p55 subfamily member 7 isoform X1 [Cuculus canorus]XP_053913766.1 MAGUK p55 subfamily member 7 isoform X1 [Cuculus canorus]XP_053913767.1 MAGUK p55 subfamily member 7 isoform X1 [Cuculus canorus]XP_053913769.1 MAGUK p55 subfamily member 7 isoform X1 [Cuculus canorus]